jgi:S1-C subfamily serine protease
VSPLTTDEQAPTPSEFTPPQLEQTPVTEQPTRKKWPIIVIPVVVAAVLGGFVGAQLSQGDSSTGAEIADSAPVEPTVAPTPIGGEPSSQPISTAAPDAAVPAEIDVPAAVGRISPSVVTVVSLEKSAMGQGRGTGTGIVLTTDGEILTNAHVVAGAQKVSILFSDSIDPIPVQVLAVDPGNDLALLKVDRNDLRPAVFADPSSIDVGDEVVAVGFALALDGGPSVTRGIISALHRTIANNDGALDGLIQTDAAISSGNSGGPLVNASGQVVGINTAVFQSSGGTAANNVGFAISVEEAVPIIAELRQLAAGGTRQEGYLGVGLDERTDGGRGALIAEVSDGSPAATAGLEAGDVVVETDGTPVDGQAAFIAAIRDKSPGDSIDIVVLRGGTRVTLTATLTQRPNP